MSEPRRPGLSVVSNVAAMRIERERLAEAEQAKRLLADKEDGFPSLSESISSKRVCQKSNLIPNLM